MVDEVPWYLDDANESSGERQGERLQKVLAQRGWGSRRTCEILISEGRVTVNDEVAALGCRVDVGADVVCVDGVPVGIKPDLVYFL
ncbi:MAG: S4 domain-containing protein, partial [Actinomycetota bacterium]|nr:S4 domain-containing protein [Actinomycetota bacterium]